MAGENRIIAIGSGSEDISELAGSDNIANTGVSSPQTHWDETWVAPSPPDVDTSFLEEPSPPTAESRTPIAIAGAVALVWTALFLFGQRDSFAGGMSLSQATELFSQWCVPVLLTAVVWLLVMRNSAREGQRFGNIARTLSQESTLLEQRLTIINRELSLAREFIASQSRDLETLGRIAADRLSQNASRLQELVRENGSRVDAISTVSDTALENMEKLRGQLPVIANSAKDITNNIANAGRTAHTQLEDMVNGFERLNAFGTASTNQISMLREQISETLENFKNQCAHLDTVASTRFAELSTQSDTVRAAWDKHETETLAAIRHRAKTLAEEIEQTRHQLDSSEEESLTSLRARLSALRTESDVVSRSLREAEDRASETMRNALSAFTAEQATASETISQAQHAAIEALSQRLAAITSEAQQIDESIGVRAERLSTEAQERQTKQVEHERYAIAHIESMLSDLDTAIAERLERHRIQTNQLAEHASIVTNQLAQSETRLEAITRQSSETENRLVSSINSLTQQLSSTQSSLNATDAGVGKLTTDSMKLLEVLQASAAQTHSVLPQALAASEERIQRLQECVSGLLVQLEQTSNGSENLYSGLQGTARELSILITALGQAQDDVSARGVDQAALFNEIHRKVVDIESTAQQAANHAGSALTKAIEELDNSLIEAVAALETESADRITRIAQELGNESAQAIDKAMRNKVAEISGQLEQAVAHSSGISREATIQLRTEVTKVDELVASLETRVKDARERAEEQVDNDFARRAALITDQLNSNAIDIATILSADISDTAWAAYLRGDRGIFTRRAVRLLEANEAKAVQQIFERDEAFRLNVSRYIHDFEGILRQVLSARDGNSLGVTLLSSDMGKLYVALAQGIERLRS